MPLFSVFALCALIAASTPSSPEDRRVAGVPLPPVPLAVPSARGLRQPALSPDGHHIAFGYRGDLWIVPSEGGAARSFAHDRADERRAIWSPDGRWIAYAARVEANYDLFLGSTEEPGAPARRLTWDEADDWPTGWGPDSRSLLFQSRRSLDQPRIYRVSIEGGEPEPLLEVEAQDGVLSPDGRSLAFVRGLVPWWRRDYRGRANCDLHVVELDSGQEIRWTEFDGQDLWPLWSPDGDALYFVSEEALTPNLYRQDLTSGERTRISLHAEEAVRFPTLAANGRRLAYECAGGLWVQDLAAPLPAAREIEVCFETTPEIVCFDTLWSGAQELAAVGDRLLLGMRGDVYALPADDSLAVPVAVSGFRERDLAVSPDGRKLLFASDEDGDFDLYRVPIDAEGRCDLERKAPYRNRREDEYAPSFSRDGSLVAYLRRHEGETLVVADADGGRERDLSHALRFQGFEISPDQRWIAYSAARSDGSFDLYLQSLKYDEELRILAGPENDVDPQWSPDGRYLYFRSNRGGGEDLWALTLRKEDWLLGNRVSRTPRLAESEAAISMDLEGLPERIHQVSMLPGDEGIYRVSPRGDWLVFSAHGAGGRDLWGLPNGAGVPVRLTNEALDPRGFTFAGGGDRLWILDREGRVSELDLPSSTEDRVATTGVPRRKRPFVVIAANRAEESRRQILREVWRTFRDRFYDLGMHLVNWDDMWRRYEARLSGAGTREDLSDLIRMMTGELDASHAGEAQMPAGPSSGDLGLETHTLEGSLRVERILPGSPALNVATEAGRVSLEVGDRLLTLAGETLGGRVPLEALLTRGVGRSLPLSWRRGGRTFEGTITPESRSSLREARESARTAARRKWVLEQSGGEVLYLRLSMVDRFGLDRLERELYLRDDGVRSAILDLRGNPGGYAHERAWEILSRRSAAYRRTRGAERVRSPLASPPGSLAVLIDRGTRSDAEILAAGVRTLGLGVLVGEPTYGGVIGTDEVLLQDGTRLRLPEVGWFGADGGNLENRGVTPDVVVVAGRANAAPEEDPSLAAALRAVLARGANPTKEQ